MGIQKTSQVTSFDATGNQLFKDQMAHTEDLEKRASEIADLDKISFEKQHAAARKYYKELHGHEPNDQEFQQFMSLLLSRRRRYKERLYRDLSD